MSRLTSARGEGKSPYPAVNERAQEAKKLSLAAKIVKRHAQGQKYSEKRLKWARQIFARRGGQARASMMTKKERHELAKKAAAASAKVRRKDAAMAELVEKVGADKLRALLEE